MKFLKVSGELPSFWSSFTDFNPYTDSEPSKNLTPFTYERSLIGIQTIQ